MARLNDKTKQLLIADYHTNNFSQRELSKKYDVSLGTVSKLTKEVKPENEHLVNAQMAILSAQSKLSNEQMNAIMNTAKDKLRREKLISTTSEKIVQLAQEMVDKNKKQVVIKVKDYSKENGSSESLDVIEIELDTSDLKNLA